MTGVRELAEVRIASPAAEQIRLSVLSEGTQLDVSLPLDISVALLLPELVELVQSRARDRRAESADEPSDAEARRDYWVLHRGDGEVLEPDDTLRSAGVVKGDLLRLTVQRTLTVPVLSDDVVDAAARLNKAAFAGWDANAARWMTFTGVCLSAAVWVYLLVDNGFRAYRGPFVGLAAAVVAALVGVAAMAHRAYDDRGIGAALGWAAVPVTAAIAWVLLAPLGDYGVATGCGAMLLVLYAFYRLIGTGHWGYLAGAVFFGLGGAAMLAHALSVSTAVAGTVLTITGTLACLTVPWATAHLGRFEVLTAGVESRSRTRLMTQPLTPAAGEPQGAAVMPTADEVWARNRSATLTRSGLYCGLAVTAATAATVVLRDQAPPTWSGAAFAAVCAVALGVYVRRPHTIVERASLGVPAAALALAICVLGQDGASPLPVVAFGALLATAVGAAALGVRTAAGRPSSAATLLQYLDYVASSALIPVALWVTGVYGRLGIAW